jgi:hypothetical protein
MNQQSPIERIVNSKFYSLLLFFVSFVFVTLFSRSTSFLYVFEGGDPSVFKQMGLSLLRGKTLYVDYFDNKGCIFENICPDYIGKPSTFNRACLTLSKSEKTQSN